MSQCITRNHVFRENRCPHTKFSDLGRMQPQVHKILGRQESMMPMQNHANADSNALHSCGDMIKNDLCNTHFFEKNYS